MKKASKALDVVPGIDLLAPASDSHAGPSIVVRLFRDHARKVQRFLSYRLRDKEDGEEAAQEVFLKLWRYEQSGTLREKASNYMYSATQSIAADVERHRSRHPKEQPADEEIHDFVAAEPAQDEVLHWRRAMAKFVTILNTLPETTRQVLVLYHIKGMSYDEIAAEIGISSRTVERHVARAVSTCRSRMRDYL